MLQLNSGMDFDNFRVLSANRQVLVLECVLTDTIQTDTLYPQVSMLTISVGYHHYPHIYKYQTFSFFHSFLSPFSPSISVCSFSGSPALLSPDWDIPAQLHSQFTGEKGGGCTHAQTHTHKHVYVVLRHCSIGFSCMQNGLSHSVKTDINIVTIHTQKLFSRF